MPKIVKAISTACNLRQTGDAETNCNMQWSISLPTSFAHFTTSPIAQHDVKERKRKKRKGERNKEIMNERKIERKKKEKKKERKRERKKARQR